MRSEELTVLCGRQLGSQGERLPSISPEVTDGAGGQWGCEMGEGPRGRWVPGREMCQAGKRSKRGEVHGLGTRAEGAVAGTRREDGN